MVDPADPAPPEAPLSPRADPDPTGARPEPVTGRGLLRSRHDRMLTGLAAGTAAHFRLDPVWVRAGLVVLAVITGGLALIGYLIASIFVPQAPATPGDESRSGVGDFGRGASVVLGLVLIGLGALWLLASLDLELNINLDIDWVLALASALVVVGALLVLSGGRLMRGPLIALGVLLLLLLGPLGTFGIPDNGGAFGDRIERVTSVGALEDDYSHAFGSLTVDLRNLELPQGTTSVHVNSAFGEATVLVPSAAAVRVEANGVFGSIEALGEESSGMPSSMTNETAGYDTAQRRLLIEVNSAFGSVDVRQ